VEPVMHGKISLPSAAKKASDRRPLRHTKPAPKVTPAKPPAPDFDRAADRAVGEIGKIAFHFYVSCSTDQQKAEFKRRILQKLVELCWGPTEITEAAPNGQTNASQPLSYAGPPEADLGFRAVR
jgi:hypothetical protein